MVLENNNLKIVLLPELGGKIISFLKKDKEFELAAQPSQRIQTNLSDCMDFSEYAYGMDDTFPNIDKEIMQINGKTYEYPDHGEIWKQSFHVQKQEDHKVDMLWKSSRFSYTYKKTLTLEKDTLRIQYHIYNYGNNAIPCIWTWHGLVRYEEDMKLLLPEEITHYRNVLGGSCMGDEGAIYERHNTIYDFGRVPDARTNSMVKYYAEEPVKSGLCKILYPIQNVVFTLRYDAQHLPYLGVWITAGGFQGDYNCALEPSSGFYDSISKAGKNGKLSILSPGQTMEFELRLSLGNM